MKASAYPLTERTTVFAESLLFYCKTLKKDSITFPLIDQLIRSGTSIGANYMEANNASSAKDFQHKIFICKKEAQETEYWLRLLRLSIPDEQKNQIDDLRREVHEFILIFQKIISSLQKKGHA